MQKPVRIPTWFLALHVVLVMAAFLMGALLQDPPLGSEAEDEAEALEIVYRFALERHVQPQQAEELLEGAIHGLIASLDDPYSRYVPPRDAPAEDAGLTGRYEGIGVHWLSSMDPPLILFPLPGSPADLAGMQPGDRVLGVNGTPVAEIPKDERPRTLRDRIRGPGGTEVTLNLERDGSPLDVVVTRNSVQSRSVHWSRLLPGETGLGYLQLKEFQDHTTDELEQAITALASAAAKVDPQGLRGLIIDLRQNGGGQLDEAVGVCRLVLEEGVIVTTRGRDGKERGRYEAEPAACRFPELPIVLLVDGESASASEVVAGCLKDNGRARIVGERTFGKGLVQTVYTWKERDFRLRLTTSHYFTPNGVCIERRMRPPGVPADEHGIAPDVPVVLPEEQSRYVMGILNGAGEPPMHHAAAYQELCKELDRPCGPMSPERDTQLFLAVRELNELVEGR